jgi:hypothetical protein
MQSREVWTGTTYALAAAMLHEARFDRRGQPSRPLPVPAPTANRVIATDPGLSEALLFERRSGSEDEDGPLTAAEKRELEEMCHLTARGIHDAGWQRFGYWFATPESWERTGQYVTLTYRYE